MISSEYIDAGLEKKVDLSELKVKSEHLGDLLWAMDRDNDFGGRLKGVLQKSDRLWEFVGARDKRSLLLVEQLDFDNLPKERWAEVLSTLDKPEEIEEEIVKGCGDTDFIQLYNQHRMIERYRFAIYDRMDKMPRENKKSENN